jgi:hypothetical protein
MRYHVTLTHTETYTLDGCADAKEAEQAAIHQWYEDADLPTIIDTSEDPTFPADADSGD